MMSTDEETSLNKRRKLDNIEDSSDSDGEEDLFKPSLPAQNIQNLYLETINRSRLDFDFEKNCSISLSNVNVYACLVCGKYLQGRGRSSYAFVHSINEDHHVFINLSTLKFYILPENYEIVDTTSLQDIKYLVCPTYDESLVRNLYKSKELSADLNNGKYRVGFVGINNSNNKNDYANVVIQLLSHTNALRDWMLLSPLDAEDELIQQFALSVKKIWSSRLFRSHISPHALLQLIFKKSNKKFSMTQKSDPKQFLVWLLNNLSVHLSKSKKKPIVNKVFQGKISLDKDKSTKFWLLSLDLPHYSLFKDGIGSEEIPQVSLSSLLVSKFGKKIINLPQTLILHFNRFQHADMSITSVSGTTRNPTVVKFPLEMDMSSYVKDADGPVMYKLVANVVHELVPLSSLENNDTDTNNWKIQVLDKVRNEWLLIHDLQVETTERELLFLKESYIQFWEKV